MDEPAGIGNIDLDINEGFAVFMHTLFIDAIIHNPQLLGFDQTDIEQLQKYKIAYLRKSRRPEFHIMLPEDIGLFTYMKASKEQRKAIESKYRVPIETPYGVGTFRIFRHIYNEKAGSVHERDVDAGLRAINDFVTHIDRKKARALSNYDPEYKKILQSGDMKQLRDFLSITQ